MRALTRLAMSSLSSSSAALPVARHDLHGFLSAATNPPPPGSALVVLNADSFGRPLLEALWDASAFRVCADGGANRVYDLLGGGAVPDAVVGDLDSARPEVLAAYAAAGAAVTAAPSQDVNDIEKALGAVYARWDAEGATDRVVRVVGAFGGRFDQVMASFAAAYKFAGRGAELTLHADGNAATLLAPGARHEITLRRAFEGPHCGLIPIGGPCESVTTAGGLRWNLDRGRLAFGDLVSTSNLVDFDGQGAATVDVETSHPLVFTISREGAT